MPVILSRTLQVSAPTSSSRRSLIRRSRWFCSSGGNLSKRYLPRGGDSEAATGPFDCLLPASCAAVLLVRSGDPSCDSPDRSIVFFEMLYALRQGCVISSAHWLAGETASPESIRCCSVEVAHRTGCSKRFHAFFHRNETRGVPCGKPRSPAIPRAAVVKVFPVKQLSRAV